MIKSEVVQLRITPEFKEKLRQAAEAENRTISNYIENLIKNALRDEE